jgi:hypothetical protein
MASIVWILEPVHNCIAFVGDEARIGGLLQRSLIHIEHGTLVLENIASRFIEAGRPESAETVRKLLLDAPVQEQWAKDLRQSDYALLNAHSLVAVWGAVETCIEDTIVCIHLNATTAVTKLAALGIVVAGPMAAATDEEAHGLYRKVEQRCRVKGDVVATNEAILRAFGLSASVGASTAATLREINAVRNCTLHRGGVVDEKAAREAPALAARLGSRITVTRSDYLKYHEAVSQWLVALMASVSASEYVPKVS